MTDTLDTTTSTVIAPVITTESPKKLTGFAAMTVERQREIARMGQAALAQSGRRYKFSPEKAREAARLGWARRNGRSVG